MLGSAALRDELRAITSQTGKPFNVNFFCHTRPTPDAKREAAWRAALAPYYALTNLFTGRCARGIMHRLMQELGPISTTVPAFPLATAAIAPLRARAESLGRGDFSTMWSGQNTSGCKEIPAAPLTRELAAGS